MNHSFNVEIAKKFGVESAIIIENLYFWISKNKANNKHFYEGFYWTYNSTRAFQILFPYWTERQLERILKKLEEMGAVKTGNFNKVTYDRTKWYSITETVECIYANGGMDLPKTWNGFTENVEPIPDINTGINTIVLKTKKTPVEYFDFGKDIEFVKITKQELDMLIEKYKDKEMVWESIKTMDNYCGADGKRYKSYYRALLLWIDRDLKKTKFKERA